MIGFNKATSVWPARAAGVCFVLGLCVFTIGRVKAQEAPPPVPWVAPDDAKKVKNPFPPTPETLADAEPLFTDNCVLCHGEKGMGDGPGAKTIKIKPANFTDAKLIAAETDAAARRCQPGEGVGGHDPGRLALGPLRAHHRDHRGRTRGLYRRLVLRVRAVLLTL